MIATFARLDIGFWFLRPQTLLTLCFIVVTGIALPVPGMAIVAAALVSSLMLSAPFLGDERGGLNTLYGVLPVTRSTVAWGRAMSILFYYVVAATLATTVTVVVSLLRDDQIALELLLLAHGSAAAVFGLAIALQLPVFFRIGYSRGRFMAYAPVLVIAGGAWLLQATGTHLTLLDAVEDVPPIAIAALGFGIGITGVVLGAALSARLYRTREL